LAYGRIDRACFQAARSTMLQQLDQRAHDAKLLAGDRLRGARAGPASAFARAPGGTHESLSAMTLDDVESAVDRLVHRRLSLVVAGDPALDPYLQGLEVLLDRSAGEPTPRLPEADLPIVVPPYVQAEGGHVGQTYLLWGTLIKVDGPTDHVLAEVATHILGGWSGSRWQTLFREELGYTYGTNASTSSIRLGTGIYCLAQVGLPVAAGPADVCRQLLLEGAADFVAHGPSPRERDLAAARLLRSEAHFHDSTRNLIARTASFLQAGLGPDFAQQRMRALRQIDPDRYAQRLREMFDETTLVALTGRQEAS